MGFQGSLQHAQGSRFSAKDKQTLPMGLVSCIIHLMKMETLVVSYKAAKCHPIVLRFSHGRSRIVKISKSLFIYFFIAFLLHIKRFLNSLGFLWENVNVFHHSNKMKPIKKQLQGSERIVAAYTQKGWCKTLFMSDESLVLGRSCNISQIVAEVLPLPSIQGES